MVTWGETNHQYFQIIRHDLSRPINRIDQKRIEVETLLLSYGIQNHEPPLQELLNEIRRQAPNFQLILRNIEYLIRMEEPGSISLFKASYIRIDDVVQNVVDRYQEFMASTGKRISYWSDDFAVMSDRMAIQVILTNLVDNAARYANEEVAIEVTRDPVHFFINVWDDGPGIPSQYVPHIFDRGWTPAIAKREEKTSSGLGLYITRTIANRYGGDVCVESVVESDPNHHTSFLLTLPYLV